jgi:serine/threonine protein kinase
MSEKPTIEQLLRQWVVLRKQGEEPDVGELCKDCPELADELRGRIAQLQADDAGTPRDTEPARPSSTQSHTADGKAKIQIGGYTILREIGHGGQGAIFKALQHSTGRHVAVKVLSETRQLSDIERARFEREAQVLAALAHPHIVSIIDRGHTAAGSAYFTMEYIEGQPLDRWLDEYRRDHPPADIPSNPGELLRLFMKIADAVNVAHLRGIIHRDLKPSNILVDDKGNPHILDFGLARLGLPAEVYSEQHRIVTMTGQFIGTLPWVSPEQAEGLTSKIDTRTDVYSLGVILYEMLTAEFPYEVVGNMRDVLDNILRAQPKPPSTVIEARLAKQAQRRRRWRKTPQNPITPDLEAIVLKALNKKPEDRYQNAGELARDIGNYLSGRPLEARGLTRVAARRYGPWIAVAAAAVLFLVTGLIWVLGLPRRTPASGASAPVALTSVREPQVLPLIPDPNLRAVVKEALGLKDRDLTLADVLRLTALDASGKAIQDLTGLEYAEKLKHLDLSENQISHIAPLAGLTGLEELSLADNRIADLRPLARLTGLTRLNLARNRDISDITPLVDL